LAPKGVALGHVVETAGYGLPCRRVYHGACQAWNNGSGACEATLRKFMKKVFRQANAAGSYTSIAIPAIGTGNLHIPAPLVAKWMYDEAEEFSRKNPNTALRDVRFVVYDRDTPTVAAFESELQSRSSSGDGAKTRSHGRHLKKADSGSSVDADDGFVSISLNGRWIVKLGTITLSVKQGDSLL